MILLLLPWMAEAQVNLNALSTANSEKSIKIIFSLSGPTRYHVFALSHPDRIVVDFENTHLKINPQSLGLVRSEIKNVRIGYPKAGVLRVVYDLNVPTHFKTAFLVQSKQLAVDFYFAKCLINVPSKHASKRKVVVVIDPGHGGKDPGAIGSLGTKEKHVVLAIAKRLENLINHQSDLSAVLTRKGDYYVGLRDRMRLARKGKADLFVSIHADSYFNIHSNGVSVYALSQRGATSEAARWLARRENYSTLGKMDLGDLEDQSPLLRSVLIDLAQTATINESLHLGMSILDALVDFTRLHYTKVEQAPFMVLKSPDIPSILVETGFISNNQEELRLRDPQYQDKVAHALLNGIRLYLKKYSAIGNAV